MIILQFLFAALTFPFLLLGVIGHIIHSSLSVGWSTGDDIIDWLFKKET